MDVLVIRRRYGNGVTTEYRRTINTVPTGLVRPTLSRTEENKRLRNTKTRRNAKQRCMSEELTHFFTFTTSNHELSCNGKELLNAVCNELKNQDVKFYAQLEVFYNKNEFHVHGLSDREIDFTSWIEKYGFNHENGVSLGEHYIDLEANLYCEEIYSSQNDCIDYINKAISETKAALPKGVHIYKSNIKKVAVDTDIEIEHIEEEQHEDCVLDSCYAVSDNVDDVENDVEAVVEVDINEKNVLKVEKPENLYKKSVLKSNTEAKGASIPLKNGTFFKNVMLLYIGYVENIP